MLLLLLLLPLTSSHKLGLLLKSDENGIATGVEDVSQFALDQLGSDVELIVRNYDDTYMSLLDELCGMLDDDVVAVVSASSSTLTAVEADVMSQFHVPYISAVATNPYLRTVDTTSLLLMAPSDKYQSQAIFALLKHYKWHEFSVLASADDRGINGVVYLQYLATRDSNFNIMDVQHFDVSKGVDVDSFSAELQEIRKSLARVIVLNCGGDHAKLVFKEAHEMGLMAGDFVWIVSDSIAGDPEKISYDGSYPSFYEGILGTVPSYGQGTTDYNSFKDDYITSHGGSAANLMMSSVLVADALGVIHETLKSLDGESWDSTPSISCNDSATWPGGETLFTKITEASFDGVSGNVDFNEDGVAMSTSYDVMNFKSNTFEKVGSWANSTGLGLTSNIVFGGGSTTSPSGYGSSLTGFHLRIGIVQESPIAYLDQSCIDSTLFTCWTGWNPDIIARLAADLNFTYEYIQPDDLRYGGYDTETGTWNGMMGDIINKKTDFTMAISINTERSTFIDFTHSFFEDQASFIVRAPTTKSSANEFFFLLPFNFTVWLSVIALVVIISFLMTFLSKLSPYGKYGAKMHAIQTCTCSECENRRERGRQGAKYVDTKQFGCVVEKVGEQDSIDDMSFYNSLFVVGTGFVGQGGETLPQAPSGRCLLFFWWLFVMILTSMYTANLTAHLTLERSSIDINSLPDLLDQNTYTWGVITDRNLESMMKSRGGDYLKLVEMGVPLTGIQDGIDRVEQGSFVFIDESSVLSFNFKDDCEAIQTNTGKFSNEWAFGLQPNSPYKTIINKMFLSYREEGWFNTKWDEWYSADGGCSEATAGSDMEFDIPILAGLFYILGIGVLCSLFMVFVETLHAAHDDSSRKRGFWLCLRVRLVLKKREIVEEWLGFNRSSEGFGRGRRASHSGSHDLWMDTSSGAAKEGT